MLFELGENCAGDNFGISVLFAYCVLPSCWRTDPYSAAFAPWRQQWSPSGSFHISKALFCHCTRSTQALTYLSPRLAFFRSANGRTAYTSADVLAASVYKGCRSTGTATVSSNCFTMPSTISSSQAKS